MSGKVQMQGRNTVTQAVVTWLADAPDWAGAQSPVPVADVTLYVRGRAALISIVCAITYPAPGATLHVGDTIVITGTISAAGTVVAEKNATTLGAAPVVGFGWSYSYTIQAGDIGSITFGATATATSGGATANAPGVTVSVAAALAPGLWLAGQSNAGNQDETPGTVDVRVSLTWGNMYSSTIRGPSQMALQDGGHSFDWQVGSDLAAHFNHAIIVGKYWADGTIVSDFLPPGGKWLGMLAVINAVAPQYVAAGISKVECMWMQGESNTPNNVTSYLPTFEADTNTVLDNIKTAFASYGLSVHFTIIQINGNFVTGPNPGDVSATSLAFVKAAEAHIATTRTDTTTVSPDAYTPNAGVHYAHGQTNTISSAIVSPSILSRY